MAITNSCVAGREMPRTNDQSKYIHVNSPGDRVYGQTAKSRKANPPNYENCTSYFVLHSSQILGCGKKRRIKPTRHRSVTSSRIINNASRPIMSEEPEQKTNRHTHSTHDQTKQGMRARFSKERKEVVSAIDPKQGHSGLVCSKERKNLITIDHICTAWYSNACTV